MRSKNRISLPAIPGTVLLAVGNFGCGGGSINARKQIQSRALRRRGKEPFTGNGGEKHDWLDAERLVRSVSEASHDAL